MSNSLTETILVPIASEKDAERTCEAVLRYVGDERPTAHVVHVIEKAGGAPDKASVSQREERAERIFDIVESTFAGESAGLETEILYGTDVAEAILGRARELDASSIVFTPRGASKWVKLVSGDVAGKLLANADRPVLVLPGAE